MQPTEGIPLECLALLTRGYCATGPGDKSLYTTVSLPASILKPPWKAFQTLILCVCVCVCVCNKVLLKYKGDRESF